MLLTTRYQHALMKLHALRVRASTIRYLQTRGSRKAVKARMARRFWARFIWAFHHDVMKAEQAHWARVQENEYSAHAGSRLPVDGSVPIALRMNGVFIQKKKKRNSGVGFLAMTEMLRCRGGGQDDRIDPEWRSQLSRFVR